MFGLRHRSKFSVSQKCDFVGSQKPVVDEEGRVAAKWPPSLRPPLAPTGRRGIDLLSSPLLNCFPRCFFLLHFGGLFENLTQKMAKICLPLAPTSRLGIDLLRPSSPQEF